MKLEKKQREKLLQWIAEGLETDEINKRAAKSKHPFKVLRSQVDYYRKTRNVKLDKIKQDGELSALKSGLALKENRIQLLQDLAEKMRVDIFESSKLWLLQVKGIGSKGDFERVEYWEFNAAEVQQLRGVIEDIAVEVGGRALKHELTGKDGSPLGSPSIDLRKLSDGDLAILEQAAEVKERAQRDPAAAVVKGN